MSDALLDANVLIRYLTRDVSDQAEASRSLLIRASEGDLRLHMTALTFAEVVCVLERFYGRSRPQIAEVMTHALALPGLQFEHADVLAASLGAYRESNVDFMDAYQATYALHRGIAAIYSYDRHFDKISGIVRLEP